jgi:hypothetical protein
MAGDDEISGTSSTLMLFSYYNSIMLLGHAAFYVCYSSTPSLSIFSFFALENSKELIELSLLLLLTN